MNAVVARHLNQSHSPQSWTGDYRNVLPYVRDAFEQALVEIGQAIPEPIRVRMIEILRWLCDPGPRRRGHPTDLEQSQFNLERIISALEVLATKAEIGVLKA